jgi:hypothetical protein
MRVCLVSMPWHLLETPCLPIGLLRSGLIISNGRDALCLPYRLRRWPIPCTAI